MSDEGQTEMTASVELGLARARIEDLEGKLRAGVIESEIAGVAEFVGKIETLERDKKRLGEDLELYDEAHNLTRTELADSEDKRNIAEHASSLARDRIDGLREKLWRLEGRCSGLLEAIGLFSK